ncbi:putative iron ascorbate-dependent oxidoreductase family protein [Lyophyllum shimeji]|uniref:Iron ascorbate-dependent oxidoreductase family protein n=1 Tax=Lyophyllum shimeji TaxID=47721 RepID=A0A9P3URD5_LYOSH|nr:putative iron ascorbate-dependent oxidoreductase family protein [Lyophyllum shimeji]
MRAWAPADLLIASITRPSNRVIWHHYSRISWTGRLDRSQPESTMTATVEPPSSGANFSSVPILDYSLLSSSKPEFIAQLRHALIHVGFLYLSNPPVDPKLIADLIDYIPKLFALPQEEKDRIRMVHSPHFLGYSRLGAELTKGRVDHREQFDIATPHETRWREGEDVPEYWRLWGPSQWPEESLIPGFRATHERYLEQVQALSYTFISLLAEAFGLAPDALDYFYDTDEKMQHRSKIVQYPVVTDADADDQGVGPHYDAGFLTFLLQASPHKGLQVQNLSGQWIDVPPIPNTFVVNIGKALEFVTQGLARATSHRVLSPRATPGEPEPTTPRYSVPFFQNISLDVRLAERKLEFPPAILQLKEGRGEVAPTDSVNFAEFDQVPSGQVNLIGRVKSHPDVAERHYPRLFKAYFPEGLPRAAMVESPWAGFQARRSGLRSRLP